MPPLTQCELVETLTNFFAWADFSCADMPRVNSYYCHEILPGITFTDPSMTRQAGAKEADINHIVGQYLKTGVLPEGQREPMFGDFSSGDDYQESIIKLQQIEEDFATLPSRVREKFGNDPEQILRYLEDENNHEEAIELGIMNAPEEQRPVPPLDVTGLGDTNLEKGAE